MSDPISRLVQSIEDEVRADDDSVDAFYRAMGKSEGEIASYRQTRGMMRESAGIGPQRAMPKSLGAIRAEHGQAMGEMHGDEG